VDGRHGCGFEQGAVGGVQIEVVPSKGGDIRDCRSRRVAIHYVRVAGVVNPAIPFASGLFRLVEHGLRDIPGAIRFEQRYQLNLGAIYIPAGKGGVLGLLRSGNRMSLPIHAAVLSVHIAGEIFAVHDVIQGGIEDRALAGETARNANAAEGIAPGRVGACANRVESSAFGVLRTQVGFCVLLAYVGDADADIQNG
jgi:hypothetical protein